jgi:hypothetical protein
MQTLNTGNAVSGLNYTANFFSGGCRRVRRDVPLDRIPDFFRSDRQLRHGVLLSVSGRSAAMVLVCYWYLQLSCGSFKSCA